MRIQSQTPNLPHQLPVAVQSKDNPAPPPQEIYQPGELRSRIESAAFGAMIIGGSAALGAFYPGAGVGGAAGLAGIRGFALSLRSQSVDPLFSAFVVGAGLAGVAAGCAVGGESMGLGFAAAAAGLGAGLGYMTGGKD